MTSPLKYFGKKLDFDKEFQDKYPKKIEKFIFEYEEAHKILTIKTLLIAAVASASVGLITFDIVLSVIVGSICLTGGLLTFWQLETAALAEKDRLLDSFKTEAK